MLKLYHGTNLTSAFDIWLHGIDLSKSLPNLDFGKGFYVTNSKIKAVQRAIKKTDDINDRYSCDEKPYMVQILVDESMFADMYFKSFYYREQGWFEFVINNRLDLDFLNNQKISNHNKDNKYDIVHGEIADGKIAEVVSQIRKSGNNNITDFSTILPDGATFYGAQYSFHTQKSLTCIKDVTCDIIKTKKERMIKNG